MTATRILTGGRIYTQWSERPWAQAIAFRDDRVLAVGSDDEIRALAGPGTDELALEGRMALPGLTDAHMHLFQQATFTRGIDLTGCATRAEFAARVRAAVRATPEGEWIIGSGWAETEWADPVMPDAAELDALSDRHPMLLWRIDMHGAVANSRALERSGVSAGRDDPEGGEIERDASGAPTGRLFELAINLVRAGIPDPTPAELDDALRSLIARLHRLGLTGAHDQRMTCHEEARDALPAYGRLDRAGELTLRLTTNMDAMEREAVFATGLYSGFGNRRLRLGHLKCFVDGSLGSRTAWMLEPYEGGSGTGIVVTPPEELHAIVREGQEHGWAISVHAIGDRANRTMLDIFEELAPTRDPALIPHRIEHVQRLDPADIPRLAALGVVASVQPIHATDDMVAADRHWGARAATGYAFRSLIDSGAVLALGSDWPVGDPNPFAGIYAAVTRQRRDGSPSGGWYPEQRITLAEAIHGYTVAPALATGRAHELGRLAPGYLADLIVVDRHLFEIDPSMLHDTRVEQVIFGGEVVHDAR